MKKDLTGKRFGRLIVLKLSNTQIPKANRRWDCICDCGNEVTTVGSNLVTGHTKSCGCLNIEAARNRKLVHGKTNTKIHSVWNEMKQRCNNPNAGKFPQYGGRGISVCKEWSDNFLSFFSWATENGYKEGLSIDRINPDGNYEPDNCRWTTNKVQCNNKTNNRIYEIDGLSYTLQQLADISGINNGTIRSRLKRGWDIKKSIYLPVERGGYL